MTTARFSPVDRPLDAGPVALTALRSWIRDTFRRRNPYDDFRTMPDWLLHDIGLTRSGLRIGPTGLPEPGQVERRVR